jgi:hypothetical protein
MTKKPPDEERIKRRLEEVLSLIPCPIAGCWGLHGANTAFYYDEGCKYYVLEVWPVGVEEPADHGGNGHDQPDLLYELAEFEFTDLAKEVPLDHLHFSQRRGVFEIGWKEGGHDLELRVHIQPEETDDEM